MADNLDTLKSYPDDPTIVMSRRVVDDIIEEIERLRAELAAVRKQHDANGKASRDRAEHIYKLRTKLNVAEAERDELQLQIKNEQWKVLSLQRTIGAMVQERHKITAERDALRAALERIADADPDDGTGYVHAVANAALNKGGGDD